MNSNGSFKRSQVHRRASVTRFAIIFTVLLLAGATGVGAAVGVASGSGQRSVSSVADEGAGSGEPTDGFTGDRVGIADPSTGELAGYITGAQDRAGLERGFPALDLGTGRYEVTGVPVTDEAGQQVGYYLTYVGFIDRAVAADPDAVDRIVGSDAAAREELADELLALRKQSMEQRPG